MYGKVIKRIRLEQNLTLRDLEKKSGFTHSGISKIENEKSTKGKEKLKVPIDTLQILCKSLNYPFRQFLEEAGYIDPISQSVSPEGYNKLSNSDKRKVEEYIKQLLDEAQDTDKDTPEQTEYIEAADDDILHIPSELQDISIAFSGDLDKDITKKELDEIAKLREDLLNQKK